MHSAKSDKKSKEERKSLTGKSFRLYMILKSATTTRKLISHTNSKHSAHHFGAEIITHIIIKLEIRNFVCK